MKLTLGLAIQIDPSFVWFGVVIKMYLSRGVEIARPLSAVLAVV